MLLCCTLLFSTAASAQELSEWAVPEYESANSAGLIPYSIVAHKLTDNVTRVEFCEAVMNFYMALGGDEPEISESPFIDTDNKAVNTAYALGIVNGKTETEFFPDDSITRQEIAKVIMQAAAAAGKTSHVALEDLEKLCNFEDFGDVDNWATTDIAKSIKYEILNGVSKTQLMPRGYATREQAIAIINRAFDAFCDDKMFYEQPSLIDLYDNVTISERLSFSWSDPGDADSYVVIIKNADGDAVFAAETDSASISLSTDEVAYNNYYSIFVGAVSDNGSTVFSDPVSIFFGNENDVTNVATSLIQRYNRVFPGGSPFASAEDAAYNMTTVSFPVWRMSSSGEKYSSTASISVNRNLADEVVKIFTYIYNDPEQFPIKNVGGYCWRTTAFGSTSQHSYGTCIDINYDENYYCRNSGDAITGSFWKPYESPFSITPDGSVVRAFAKYGWTWGGTWSSLKDYMHFSYLGN